MALLDEVYVHLLSCAVCSGVDLSMCGHQDHDPVVVEACFPVPAKAADVHPFRVNEFHLVAQWRRGLPRAFGMLAELGARLSWVVEHWALARDGLLCRLTRSWGMGMLGPM